jgi:hypothetical protein
MSARPLRLGAVGLALGTLLFAANARVAQAQSCSVTGPSGGNYTITCSGVSPLPTPTTAPSPLVAPISQNSSGGGGDGGHAGALFVSAGNGDSGNGGNTISGTFGTFGSTVYSTGLLQPGIMLISNGGNGGGGGNGYAGASAGSGGNGGNGGVINASTTGAIITTQLFAPGVWAQSAGGVGGDGGGAYVSFGGGGNGAPGGIGNSVTLSIGSNI